MPRQNTIVIVGAGFAGAACAWWLTRLGVQNVVVLEREEAPGMHASGLNAGMAREFEEDEILAPLASEGVAFIRNPPDGFAKGALIKCNGSLLLFSEARGKKQEAESEMVTRRAMRVLRNTQYALRNTEISSCFISKSEAIQKIPLLSDAKFDHALWTPTDGIVDIHAYLWAFINGAKAAGAKFFAGVEVKEIKIENDVITGIKAKSPHTPLFQRGEGEGGGDIEIKCACVINAAGAWAEEVATLAGAEDLGIKSYRRHLYCTPPMPKINPKWPFVWDVEFQYYFRPESGGLLLGPADEEEVGPGIPCTNPRIREMLAEKLTRYCPSLAEVSIAREWCGLRTFAPDRRPLIKWDKKIKNFFWLTALGGRGVTCAASAGRIAAEKIRKFMVDGLWI